MLKYIHTIRLGVKHSQAWKNYDEQFRLRKLQDPTSSWALIDQELWLLYLYSNPSNPNVSSLGSGYKCYPFNYQGNCTTQFCSYSHNCLRCNGEHPLLNCPRQNINPNRFGEIPQRFQQNQSLPTFRPRVPVDSSSARFSPRNFQNAQRSWTWSISIN
jgi:hypothetical protein